MSLTAWIRSSRVRRDRRRERDALLRARWESLPESTRTPMQWIGRSSVSCGATHGVMEKCNYSCTSCYLTERADYARPLPFEKVKTQLETLRKELGHGGKVQITSGEVTLLKKEELGRLVRTARDLGLDAMVMTNGQRFFDDPSYLPTLVRDYGLEKVCCHVDITQPERAKKGDTERDLQPFRDQYADLVRSTRRETKKPLHAAHTVTVTPENLEGVADIVAWGVRNADAVRMISFQPVASVGRTKDARGEESSFDAVWSRVQRGCGAPISRDAVHTGHQECNATVPILVIDDRKRAPKVVEVLRPGSKFDRAVMSRAMSCNVETGAHPLEIALSGLGAIGRAPWTFVLGAAWLGVRGTLLLPTVLGSLLRGRMPRLRPMLLVVHRFMSPEELDTEEGKERLAACTFKLPLEDGSLVAMCEMNATDMRQKLTDELIPERFKERFGIGAGSASESASGSRASEPSGTSATSG